MARKQNNASTFNSFRRKAIKRQEIIERYKKVREEFSKDKDSEEKGE